jgi:SEC-C motif
VGVSLLWTVGAPVYATGLGAIGRALIPFLESAPGTRYTVEGGTVLAHRPLWLPKQQRMTSLVQPLWSASANYGVPLLVALILATPGWSMGRRWPAMAIGLGLLSISQVAFLLVYIVATQQSPVMSPEGPIWLPGFSPVKRAVFYWLFYFFEITGRGFFALLIYLGLVALTWKPRPAGTAAATRSGRNAPCPCGSGLKYKRCCGA